MTKDRIKAGLIILAFVASIPILNHLDRKFFAIDSIYYPELGIGFSIRNYSQSVIGISVVPAREEAPPVEGEGEKIIFPGRGMGEIRLGDSPEQVKERWPGDWKKFGYREQTGYSNAELEIQLQFDSGQLSNINTSSSEYRTREGISVGDRKDKVLEAYGEPPKFPGRFIVSFSILGSITGLIPRFLIAAGGLAFLNYFLVKREMRRRESILVLSAYFSFLLIYQVPSLVQIGVGYFPVYLDPIMLVSMLFGAAFPAAVFAGIIFGVFIVRRCSWKGWKRHAIPVIAGDFFLVAVVIIWRIYQALLGMMPFSLWFWSQLVMLLYGPLLYLFWHQFNVLFARAPRAPVPRVQPVL